MFTGRLSQCRIRPEQVDQSDGEELYVGEHALSFPVERYLVDVRHSIVHTARISSDRSIRHRLDIETFQLFYHVDSFVSQHHTQRNRHSTTAKNQACLRFARQAKETLIHEQTSENRTVVILCLVRLVLPLLTTVNLLLADDETKGRRG